MQNITQHNTNELSLLFRNTENLYNKMIKFRNNNNKTGLIDFVMDEFIYTEEQLDNLIENFDNIDFISDAKTNAGGLNFK